ncbi:phage regulatory protein/antirepressor Ant [Mycetocola reblochoni]|nr:phage regulatory protein/antirepressor Ant [Mycetocola reblochoni]
MSNDIIQQVGGELRVSSETIAQRTEVEHRAVLQLVSTHDVALRSFGPVAFEMRPLPGGGNPVRVAHLNEPQATLLMTFMRNSVVVVDFKVELVAQFYRMRRELAGQVDLPRSLPDALRAYAMEVEKSAALEAKVQEDAPKMEAFEQFLGAAGDLDLRETAQSLDLGRTRLADFLRRQGFFSPGSTTPYQRFVDRGWFRPVTRVSQRPEGPKAYQVTLVTPAGREAIRERLEATRSNLVAVV